MLNSLSFRGVVVIALLAGGVGGCHRRTAVEIGAEEQVLHFGNGAEPKDLDPATQIAAIEYTIDLALFEGLVTISGDGKILPGVASRWEISADQLTYTFHLRPDAVWSDGSPLTADDFVYAFRRVFTPTIPSPNNFLGLAISGAKAMSEGKGTTLGVRAIDAHTLEVHLDFPTPYILFVLGGAPFVPVPRAVVERFGDGFTPGNAWTRPGNFVGNGAFVLSSWTPNKEIVATRNPHYWGRDQVRLKEIRFYPTDDANAEEREFRAGQLHVTFSLPISKVPVYQATHDGVLHTDPLLETFYLLINPQTPPFTDIRVRRALSLALDRDRLVAAAARGIASPAHTLTRPGTAGYTPPSFADFDPALAKKLLADAGYPEGKGFPAVSLFMSSSPLDPLYEAVQESWRQVLGVRVTLQREEHKVFLDDMIARRFQLAATGYFYGIDAPETVLMIGLSDCPWNYSGVKDPAYDRAFAEANYAPTEAKRRAAYDTLERTLHDGAFLIPIAYGDQPYLVSPLVKGWQDNSLGVVDWRSLSLGK